MIKQPSLLSAHAESQDVSVLFTDIEGFCRFVESVDPKVVQRVLNDYFECASEIVHTHNGTIDKIVGDALHVFFSAPIRLENHATVAIKCALDLSRHLSLLKARHAKEGIEYGETRIGVHSGRGLVGNFGGPIRFDYTVHGSVINMASRLELLNKATKTSICTSVSEIINAPDIVVLPLGLFLAKGFNNPIPVFTPTPRFPGHEKYFEQFDSAVRGDPSAFQSLLFDNDFQAWEGLIRFQRNRVISDNFTTAFFG